MGDLGRSLLLLFFISGLCVILETESHLVSQSHSHCGATIRTCRLIQAMGTKLSIFWPYLITIRMKLS